MEYNDSCQKLLQHDPNVPVYIRILSAELKDLLSEWKQRTDYDYDHSPSPSTLKPIHPKDLPLAGTIGGLAHELIQTIKVYEAQVFGPRGYPSRCDPTPQPFAGALASAFRQCCKRVAGTSREPALSSTVSEDPGSSGGSDFPPAYTP
ncbi:hypothetical protein HK104_007348, partial [Borealophlyctis nickersoniae]